jgi:hypothetical protein
VVVVVVVEFFNWLFFGGNLIAVILYPVHFFLIPLRIRSRIGVAAEQKKYRSMISALIVVFCLTFLIHKPVSFITSFEYDIKPLVF